MHIPKLVLSMLAVVSTHAVHQKASTKVQTLESREDGFSRETLASTLGDQTLREALRIAQLKPNLARSEYMTFGDGLDVFRNAQFEKAKGILTNDPIIKKTLRAMKNKNLRKGTFLKIVKNNDGLSESLKKMTDQDFKVFCHCLSILVGRSGFLGVAFGVRALASEGKNSFEPMNKAVMVLVQFLAEKFDLKAIFSNEDVHLESRDHILSLSGASDALLSMSTDINQLRRPDEQKAWVVQGLSFGLPIEEIAQPMHDRRTTVAAVGIDCTNADREYPSDSWGKHFRTIVRGSQPVPLDVQLQICDFLDQEIFA
jgi:hypothetical protein